MPTILNNAYLQGGAILLLVAALFVLIVCMLKYIVKPLWEDNKTLREKVMQMNERVAVMGEANRATNINVKDALDATSKEILEVTVQLDNNGRKMDEALGILRSIRGRR